MDITDKDLNLLAVFAVIAEELNLSRAGSRLNLSQPALSHALSRLRQQFGDPLFVRGQRGLIATPRVGSLLPRVRACLDLAKNLYGGDEPLDLSTIQRKVVIACTAYFEGRVIPDFVQRLLSLAPGLKIETRSLSSGFPKQELENGDIDLAIAAYFTNLPNGFRIKTIFRDRFVCVSATKHPYPKSDRALADYLACRHLQIEVPPGVIAPVDQYLGTKKKHREITLRLGNFFTPPVVLHKAEHLVTCPLSLAEVYAKMYDLTISELPFSLPGIETQMVWHEKNQHDPFHEWLREAIQEK